MRTYLIVVPVLVAFGALLFRSRGPLLGANLGTNRGLIAIALACYGVMIWLQLQYRKQLSIATLVAVTELSPTEQRNDKLLQDGIYRVGTPSSVPQRGLRGKLLMLSSPTM